MKKFVFNFNSKDRGKFAFGKELFNIIITALVFNQSVIIILNSLDLKSIENNLLFLSDIFDIPGDCRIIFDRESITRSLSKNMNKSVELLTKDKIKKVISEADYYVNC